MAHIKRAKVAEEAKREAENPIKGKYFDQSILSVAEKGKFLGAINVGFLFLIFDFYFFLSFIQ